MFINTFLKSIKGGESVVTENVRRYNRKSKAKKKVLKETQIKK